MEYIKKEELIKGEIYTHLNGNIVKYQYLDNTNNVCGSHIGENKNRFVSDLSIHTGSFNITELKLATSEEKHWLNTCIKLDKFITFEEAMKSFIPEYVECTQEQHQSSYKVGIIYKLKNTLIENEIGGMAYWTFNQHRFKPSTKEAYDAQFVVKEPEFVLPEKWCLKITKENLDFCKSLENNELHYKKNYNYYINGYYSAIRSDSGNYGFSGIPITHTEITFEQFKKYVLKEETVVEEVIKPLPQFKVIETIETITKVENNEGNQFFIGDTVKSDTNVIHNIKGFKYDINKIAILALTDKVPTIGVSINKIEHYIESKVVEPEFILPENWHIVITKENIDIVKQWWDSKDYGNRVWSIGACYGIDNKDCISKTEKRQLPFNNKEITFDQFKKYVLKEEVKEETLLEKAKRLYPIGTKFKSAYSGKVFTIKNHSQESSNPTAIVFGTNEPNNGGGYYGCIYYGDKFAEIIE